MDAVKFLQERARMCNSFSPDCERCRVDEAKPVMSECYQWMFENPGGVMDMKLGYIAKYDLKLNPHLTEQFAFKEAPFTRRISANSDRVYSKLLSPVDYEEIVSNANIMRNNPKVILVREPFLLDDELREKAIRWVDWANKADPREYDPFAK